MPCRFPKYSRPARYAVIALPDGTHGVECVESPTHVVGDDYLATTNHLPRTDVWGQIISFHNTLDEAIDAMPRSAAK